MKERVAALLAAHLKTTPPSLELMRLHGDASYRTYYRARIPGGKSWVVMQLPEGIQSASEEITNLKEPGDEIPFVDVARFLKKNGLPVPAIHHYERTDPLLLLEDVGDLTLGRKVEEAPQETEGWYRKAIDLLVEMQERAQGSPTECVALRRGFDETLLNWEFDHFLEYGLEARGIRLPDADKKIFHQQTRFLTFALTRLPQVFVHRDFQSRNLMIQNGRLRLIDFQDALMGPELYDLVALLRDSYVTLPWNLVEKLIRYYLEKQAQGVASESVSPYKMFDWVTIQRKLKDAGRFVYIDRVKKNPGFLPFIPASLGYVREALGRQPELKPLTDLLKRYLPEFHR